MGPFGHVGESEASLCVRDLRAAVDAHRYSFGRHIAVWQPLQDKSFYRSLKRGLHNGILVQIARRARFTPVELSAHAEIHTPLIERRERPRNEYTLALQRENALRIQLCDQVVAISFTLEFPVPAYREARAEHFRADCIRGKQRFILK